MNKVKFDNPPVVSVQVNGVNIEGMRHAEVVAFIKRGGDEIHLLVVDPDTDEHFKKLGITPGSSHVKGAIVSASIVISADAEKVQLSNMEFAFAKNGHAL